MAYQKQTWVDYPSEITPISAERLNHMEDGIENAGESAGNLRFEFDSEPIWMKDNIPANRLRLFQYINEGQKDYLSYVDCADVDSVDKLRALIQCVCGTAVDSNTLILKKQNILYNINICYKDQENTEYQYTLQSGNLPPVYYSMNNYSTLPKGITQSLQPVNIYSPLLEYGGYFVDKSDLICYIKYQGNKVPTFLFKLYGHQTFYLAYAMYSSQEAVIIPIDTSTHEIVTNDYIGTRYRDGLYSYYPFNVVYYISESGNTGNEFTFSNITDRPVYYYDGSSYQSYSYSGNPFVYGYINDIDFNTLDLDGFKVTLNDGTTINYGYVSQDKTIACPPPEGYYGIYYIYNLGTDKYILLNLYPSGSSGVYVYATILNTSTHIYSASPELYGPYIPMTLYFKKLQIINDSEPSSRTVYSSNKVEALLADIQAQLDAIPAEKEVVYPDASSISTTWSVNCFTYLDSNDEYVPYTSSDDRLIRYPYFGSDNAVYENHWTPKILSILFGNLQITDGVVSVDTNYAYHDPTGNSGINKVFSVPIPNETDKYLVLGIADSSYANGYIGIIDTTNHTVTSTPPGDVWSISGLEIKYEK